MKVLMIGGTGLLGSAAAQIFVDRGNEIKTLALPPLPEGAPLPKEMEIVFQDANKLSDDEMIEMMKGYDMFVFATGVDERVEFPAPVYDYYYKYNIAPLERYLPLAKKAGMKGAVVCGSYFSWLAKERPDMKLTEKHPYIKSRIDQENVCEKYSSPDFQVGVLELPYIFGTQPGRKPVWVILIEQLQRFEKCLALFIQRAALQCSQFVRLANQWLALQSRLTLLQAKAKANSVHTVFLATTTLGQSSSR